MAPCCSTSSTRGCSAAASVVSVWAAIPAWVDAVVAARPYASVDALTAHAAALADAWTSDDLDAALAHHPRIGQRPIGAGAEAAASRREQASMTDAAAESPRAIAAGNAAYEERFGRVFLIRAAGRPPEQILAELRRRLANDDDDGGGRSSRPARRDRDSLRLRASRRHRAPRARGSPHEPPHHPRPGCRDRSARRERRRLARAASPGRRHRRGIAQGFTDADGRLALGPERARARRCTP